MLPTPTPIAQLALDAHKAALSLFSTEVEPVHLLWALCTTEEGRRAVEEQGGDYTAILRYISSHVRERHKGQRKRPDQAFYTPAFHQVFLGIEAQAVDVHGGVDAVFALTALRLYAEEAGEGLLVEALAAARFQDGVGSDAGAFAQAEEGFDPFKVAFGDALEDDEPGAGFGEGDSADSESEAAMHPQPGRGVSAAAAALASDPNMAAALAALRNLTLEAREGRGDPVIGRHAEIAELRAVLERRRKPNALLVGEPGVGKTALVEGLARDLLAIPHGSPLSGRPVFELEMGALMAGTRFRGDFEARMRHVLDQAAGKRAILFIDEAHALIGAGGGAHSGGMDASTLLKPALARGEISVILATTPAETRALVKDRAFARRFQRVQVGEPDVATTVAMVARARGPYETHHGVTIPEDFVESLVEAMALAAPERRFPDKAFDALDAAAQAARRRGSSIVGQQDVDAAVFAVAGVRLGRVGPAEIARAEGLESALRAAVLGQDEAVSALASAVRLRMLGLQGGSGCASAHLLNGPSGVGKTETAKALAKALDVPLVRIDMSEFMDPHAISGLIGAPPGYVGFQDDGLLIAAGEAHPRMVLLLDEVDKAHPRVFDVLLQIMDAGRLTSPDGRVVSFRGTHLVMTANIGASEAARPAMGFGRTRDADAEMRAAVAAHVRPEFAERLTTALTYQPLDRAAALAIARAALAGCMDRFARMDCVLSAGEDVAAAIVDGLPQGPVSGRRILRAVEARVADAVALEALKHPPRTPLAVRLEGEKAHLVPAA